MPPTQIERKPPLVSLAPQTHAQMPNEEQRKASELSPAERKRRSRQSSLNKFHLAKTMAPISTTQSEQVLKEVIEDGAFNGSTPVRLSDDHAVSFDRQTETAALACGGGWMIVPFDVIRRLAEFTAH